MKTSLYFANNDFVFLAQKHEERDRDFVETLKIEIPSSSHKRTKKHELFMLVIKKKQKLYARNEKNAFEKVLAKRS